ncbi:unnamed protein product [Nippostrongylus brasiliensis]|uniref:N-acetylmuramoyl-L-alanine amidase n=1 Tax=Nippostrongylus brasiliensis TaxID=27835 RepID=A0A0N4XY53_NIPBR|nr:unnamed protein product [Nippostrongylus brasiliensis]
MGLTYVVYTFINTSSSVVIRDLKTLNKNCPRPAEARTIRNPSYNLAVSKDGLLFEIDQSMPHCLGVKTGDKPRRIDEITMSYLALSYQQLLDSKINSYQHEKNLIKTVVK